jgi:DNA-repair protein XRCC2
MADADIAIVAVDSISAFYWPDRFTAEQLRPGHANYIPPLQNVLAALQKFRQSHQAVTILSNWGLNPADNSSRTTAVSPVLFYKQHLPSFPTLADRARPPSTLSLTHQITLSASPSPPFHGTLFIPQNLERCEITGCIRTSNSTNSFVVDIPPEMYKSST